MSASREKKKRQELLASGAVDPKTAREAEKKAAERKSSILYGTVAVLFVVVAIALVVYNSGIIQRNQTAVTIDGEKYTVPQVSYYYWQAYQNFLNSDNGYFYTALGMLDTSQSLKSQDYTEDQTWDEHFKEEALDTMRLVHAAKAAAQADGVTLDSNDQATLQANLDSFKSAASQAGYSYKAYLGAIYGATMTPSIYESCMEDLYLASKYANVYAEQNFVYSDEEIESYYEDNRDTYDLIDGAYVVVSGSPETQTDSEGNTIEATDEEKAAAMAAAKETAESILADYRAGGDLEALASANDLAYSTSIPGSTSVAGAWFYDSTRRSGDSDIIENESGSTYYVAAFQNRERNSALDYSVRHILVTADSLDLAEGEEATEDLMMAKAQEILSGWDGTEEGFASLANQYSQDPGSNTNGGLYENVASGTMVAAFENWCYEDGRKSGDNGIIYNSSTGVHIMYFVGYGSTEYWHYACESALRSSAQSDWQQSMVDSVTAERSESGMNSIG